MRVDRGELVEFQVDGTHGSATAGLFGCRIQPRAQTPEAGLEPRPAHRPGLPRRSGSEVPDIEEYPNGFRAQWEQFLRDVDAGRPHGYDLAAGVRGLQLVEAGSAVVGRRVAASSSEIG